MKQCSNYFNSFQVLQIYKWIDNKTFCLLLNSKDGQSKELLIYLDW